jgi:hypothetical protein
VAETEVTHVQYAAAYDSVSAAGALPKALNWFEAALFANRMSSLFKSALGTDSFYVPSDTLARLRPTRLILAPYIAVAETTDTAAIIDTIVIRDSLYYLVFNTVPDTAWLNHSPARIVGRYDSALAVPYDTVFEVKVWGTNTSAGGGFRLPTEAEWEEIAACGQGLVYSTANGKLLPETAVYGGTAPAAAGGKPANPYGLYDLTGNLSEWTHDWWTVAGNAPPTWPMDFPGKTLKGGGFRSSDTARALTVGGRRSEDPSRDLSGEAGARLVSPDSPKWIRIN